MPPRKKNAKNPALAMGDGIDRLGALPDEVLHHVLSFLRAQDAVRTCVLARRWRHLWRFATGLRIGCGEDEWAVVQELREFVDNLFLLRGLTPLVKCEFSFDEYRDEDVPRVMLWIKHAIQCEVQMLRLKNICSDGWPFSSQHLTKLDLEDMLLKDKLLNFSSSCPALQNLTLTDCSIECTKISSESLKCLSITKCRFSRRFRTHVCAPSLISLRLDDHWYKTPVLESMPSLVDAIVRVIHDSADCCTYSNYWDCGFEDCEDCYGDTHDNGNCVLLEGLSEAKSLALVAETNTVRFKPFPSFIHLC
jgi:hypothetical protein